MQLMLPATIGDCLSFDPFAFEEDGLGSSEVDVGRHEIAQALVIAGMVVMSHESRDLTFEIAGQIIVLEQERSIFPGSAGDKGRCGRVPFSAQPLREILRDV